MEYHGADNVLLKGATSELVKDQKELQYRYKEQVAGAHLQGAVKGQSDEGEWTERRKEGCHLAGVAVEGITKENVLREDGQGKKGHHDKGQKESPSDGTEVSTRLAR